MNFEDEKIRLIDVELVQKTSEEERASIRANPAMAHIRALMTLNGESNQFKRKVLSLMSLACRNVLVLTKKKSGSPKIPMELIQEIEAQALTNGWTKDQLYGDGRTLQTVLQTTDSIEEVTPDFIRIRHDQGTKAKFYRNTPM